MADTICSVPVQFQHYVRSLRSFNRLTFYSYSLCEVAIFTEPWECTAAAVANSPHLAHNHTAPNPIVERSDRCFWYYGRKKAGLPHSEWTDDIVD